ncbi:MAG: DUF342 domain-containing protein [Chitinivibrionales bacterium]|nr:DUF342 domain-containing protein [Chitinivibrionales bacterium]
MAAPGKKIEITVTSDSMSAFAGGSVHSRCSCDDAASLVREALDNAGVVYGIIDDLVIAVAKELCGNKWVRSMLVAAGDPPHPSTPPGATFFVKTYDVSQLPPEVVSAPRAVYSLIVRYIPDPHVVKKGTVVGKYEKSRPEKEGIDVRGRTIPVSDIMPSGHSVNCIERGLAYDDRTEEIAALKKGIVLTNGNHCLLLPVTRNGAFTIDVSEDRCAAFVEIYPARGSGKNPSKNSIIGALKKAGITGTCDRVAIEKALDGLHETSAGACRVKAVEGKYPVNGEDGMIDFKVNLNFSSKPKILPDGRADYYSIHLFENVKKNQELARVIPPKQGVPGTDVYGNPIPAQNGKPVSVRGGKNVVIDTYDNSRWLAGKDGHVYFRDGKIIVEEVLNIEGNVDFHTGNIAFVGDVVVTGDVCSGFTVGSDGNICIHGTVEDARVESKQSIVLKSGFIGTGKGTIVAGRDVVAAFVRNQRIIAKNSIMIAGEVIEASLHAGKKVLVESPKSWIIGGISSAKKCVRAHSIGNESGVFTRIEAGVDYFIEQEIRTITATIKKQQEERRGAERALKQLMREETARGGLSGEKGVVRARLSVLCSDIDERIEALKNKRSYLKDSLYDTNAEIVVPGTAYCNTALSVAGTTLLLHDDYRRTRFYHTRSKIKNRPL